MSIFCHGILHQHGLIVRKFHSLICFLRKQLTGSVDHRCHMLLDVRSKALPIFTPTDHIFDSHEFLKQRIGRCRLHQTIPERLLDLERLFPEILKLLVIGR